MNWEYVDSTGVKQGPFDKNSISAWIKKGLFPGEIKIRLHDSSNKFVPVKDTIEFSSLFSEILEIPPKPEIEDEKEQEETFKTGEEKSTEKDEKETAKKKNRLVGDSSTIGPEPDSDEIHWLYIDNNGKIQGPFANSLMHFWLNEKHFDCSLKVLKFTRSTKSSSKDDPERSSKALVNPKNLVISNFISIDEICNCDIVKKWNDYERLNWFYIDADETERGPFSSEAMMKWMTRGFLRPSLQIRTDISRDFVELAELNKPFGIKAKEVPKWSYFDDEGVEFGPFLTSLMTLWYLQGFFQKDTLCKNPSLSQGYFPISEAASHFTKNQEQTMEQMSVPVIKNPTAKGKSEKWYFIDVDKGQEQGPFSKEAMKSWRSKGFLPDFIKVRRGVETDFVPISSHPYCDFAEPEKKHDPPSKRADPLLSKIHMAMTVPMFNQGLGGDQIASSGQFSATIPGSYRAKNSDWNPNSNIGKQKREDSSEPVNLESRIYKEPDWYYIGKDKIEYGPFSSGQMRHWWQSGTFKPDLLVRQSNEPSSCFRPLSTRECCFTAQVPPPLHLQGQKFNNRSNFNMGFNSNVPNFAQDRQNFQDRTKTDSTQESNEKASRFIGPMLKKRYHDQNLTSFNPFQSYNDSKKSKVAENISNLSKTLEGIGKMH